MAGKVRNFSKFSACVAENTQIKVVVFSVPSRLPLLHLVAFILYLTGSSFESLIHPF